MIDLLSNFSTERDASHYFEMHLIAAHERWI